MQDKLISSGIKFGVVNGIIAIAVMYVSWAGGIEKFTNVQFWATFIPYMFVILLLAGLQLKKQNGGFIPFKDVLKFTFLSYVISGVIVAIGTYILYNLVDKDLTEKSLRVGLDKTRKVMERMGASEKDIEKTMDDATKGKSETSLKNIFLGFGFTLIVDFVKCLLLSIIIRKEQPVAPNAL